MRFKTAVSVVIVASSSVVGAGVLGTAGLAAATPSDGPTVGAPTAAFVAGTTIDAATLPVSVSWPAATDPDGICRYKLEQSTAGAAFVDVALPKRRSTSVVVPLSPSTNYRFRVQAIDCLHNRGPKTTSRPLTPLAWQESSPDIEYFGTWPTESVAGAYGGAVQYSVTENDSAAQTFYGNAVAWVAQTGPTFGKAAVYIDDVFAERVKLNDTPAAAGQVVFAKSWPTQGMHKIEILVVGTAGRPRVDVDAILTVRQGPGPT